MLGSQAMAGDTISFARGAPERRHPARTRRCGRRRRGRSPRTGRRRSPTGPGSGIRGSASGSPSGTAASTPAQVMVANGSLEAAAMLFEHLLEPGDRVVVEQPTYDRTLLLLQRLGVELVPVPLEADGLDLGALRGGARRGADQARPRHPQLPQPGRLHALGREAGAAGRARRRARLLDLRGRPLPRAALRGRGAGDDARDRQGRPGRSTPPPSRRRSAPACGSATWPGPAEEIAKLAKRANETYISPNMLAESIVLELCRSGGLDRNIEFVNGALRERARRAGRGAAASRSPRPSSSSPAAATSSGSTSPRAPTRRALLAEAKGEGVAFVAGPDFMIEGGEQQPAPLLRQRAAGADRRGRRAHRPGARAHPRRLARLAPTSPPSRRAALIRPARRASRRGVGRPIRDRGGSMAVANKPRARCPASPRTPSRGASSWR